MIKKGSNSLSKIYLGSTEITKAYLGANQIYPNSVPSTTSDLTFTTSTNLLNTAQVFTANGGGFGFGHTGLDVLSLAANQNGRIYCRMTAGDSSDFGFGFNSANAQAGINSMEIAYDRQATTNDLFRFSTIASVYDTGAIIANGKYLGFYRVGGLIKCQQSADAITWVDVGEFLFQPLYSSAAQLFVTCDLHTLSVMYHPKIQIFGTGNLARAIIQDGDSIAWGQLDGGNVSITNIGYQAYAALQGVRDTFYKNVAVPGSSIDSRLAALATDVYPLFGQAGNGFDKIIVSINCGVNNLGGGSDNAASTYPKMMNYISTILNQDSRTCVMVYTIINANPLYATKAEIDAYNALLLATTQTARLKVVNTTTEPLLTSVGACDNTTYYQADKVHLTQAGYNLLGALGQAVALTF